MPFKRIVYGELNCPRCNAIAEVRNYPRPPMAELRIVCSKCKLNTYYKVTTEKALIWMREEIKLLEKLKHEPPSQKRFWLERELARVRKRIHQTEVLP